MLDKQAIAHNYGLIESTLYSASPQKRKSQKAVRSDLSLDGLLRFVKTKAGRPAELSRDIHRAILVKTYQIRMKLNKTRALRYVAGIEAVSKIAIQSGGKQILINVGAQHKPKYVPLIFYEKRSVKDDLPTRKVFRVEPDPSAERQIQRSIENVEKEGFELLEIRAKKVDELAEWQGAIIPIPRSYMTLVEAMGLRNKLIDQLPERCAAQRILDR